MNADDFDHYYLGPDGKVWKLAYLFNEPTATFERGDDPSIRSGGAVTSPLVREFRRLVVEERA